MREVQELVGFLQFSSQVIPHSRAFIRRLIDFSSKFSTPFSRLHIPSGARSDLGWWSALSAHWNGVQIIDPDRPTIYVETDASGRKGLGGVWQDFWFASCCPRRFRDRDIQFKEIYTILQAILRWGDTWFGTHVVFRCDNQAVVQWLSSDTARSAPGMSVLRQIILLSSVLHFTFSAVWIPTSENALAEAASCFQYSRLFHLAPQLCQTSSTPRSQIIGIRRTLTSLEKSHFSSGAGSLPRPGTLTHPPNDPFSTSFGSTPSMPPLPVSSSLRLSSVSWPGPFTLPARNVPSSTKPLKKNRVLSLSARLHVATAPPAVS